MSFLSKHINKIIFGDNKEISLDRTVFIIITIALFFIGVSGNIINIILDFSIGLILITAIAIIVVLFFYFIARNSKNYKKYVIPGLVLSILFIIFFWFLNDGYNGNTINLMFIFFIGIFIIIPAKMRFIFFITFTLIFSFLAFSHHYYPEYITQYKNEKQRFFDLLIGNITYFIFLYFILDTILKKYINENNKVKTINEELERKSAELAKSNALIKENEERFRHIAEQLPEVIFLTDNFGNITYISPGALKLFGYKPDEMTENPFFNFLAETEIEKVMSRFKDTLFSKEKIIDLPLVIKTKNGKNINIELNASVYTENNVIVGTIGVIKDISERLVIAEEILILSKVVEQSPSSIMITDVNGNIEYVNANFTDITGFTTEESFGQKPNILKSGYQDKNFYSDLWKTILSGKEWRGEIYNKKKNGEFYWENASIFPIKNDEGKISHFIALKQDITEKKQMIDELIQAKEKAEESDRLKSAFLANMSHEIRTPLNGIIGFSKILGEKKLLKEQREKYYIIVNRNTETLLNIINDILDISKIESGQLEISKSLVNVNIVLSELHTQFSKKIKTKKTKNVSIKCNQHKDEIHIYTDHFRLRQIFTNLLDNAIKFTQTGSIEFGFKETKKNNIFFYVQDTGIGIPKEQQPLIYDRFRQIEQKGTNLSGNGLGLAIVKQLVDLLGGGIRLKSEVGKGTMFTFWLPADNKI